MHGWMGKNYPQSNADQMTQYMREQIGKDIQEKKYGTLTDLMLGGMSDMMNGSGGMMGGYGGMMGGSGGMMNIKTN